MRNSTCWKSIAFVFFVFLNTSIFGQINISQLKGKWEVEKFDEAKASDQEIQAKKDLVGICLTFHDEQMIVSKRTAIGDSVIKKGSYFLSGDTILIGKDRATILLLSQRNLKILIPRQGTLYLTKM
jgi:hypothetical protein